MTSEQVHTAVHGYQAFEKGARQVFLMTLFGFCLSAVLAFSNLLYGNVPWSAHLAGYAMIAVSISACSLVADRIWKSTTEPLVRNSRAFVAFFSRLPFWYFGGGIGYVLGLLVAKKVGLLTVYDIPVKGLFTFGGLGIMLVRIPFQRLMIFLNRLG